MAQTVAALTMADDRNRTVHTYIEALADDIHSHIRAHAELLHVMIAGMRAG